MKKIISVMCAIVFLASGIVASASSENARPDDCLIEEVSVGKVFGDEIPDSFKADLQENDVVISDTSVLEIIPLGNRTSSIVSSADVPTALVITNETQEYVTKDVLLLIDQDGSPDRISLPMVGANSPKDSSSANFPPLSWDGDFMIHATAEYQQYSGVYIRPSAVSFSYTKYRDCNISSIAVSYIVDGFRYSYPSFTNLGYDEYVYTVTASKTTPEEGWTYRNFKAFFSGEVLYIGAGSPFVGQFLTFDFVKNGVTRGDTVIL